MNFTISYNKELKKYAIYPEINEHTPMLKRTGVIWRKRKDHALNKLGKLMETMK